MPYPCCCIPVPGPCNAYGDNPYPDKEVVTGEWDLQLFEGSTDDADAILLMVGTISPAFDWIYNAVAYESGSSLLFDYSDQFNFHRARVEFESGVGGTFYLERVSGGSPTTIAEMDFDPFWISNSGGNPAVGFSVCRDRSNVQIRSEYASNFPTRPALAYGPIGWIGGSRFGLQAASTGGRFFFGNLLRTYFDGDPYQCTSKCEITCVGMYFGREPSHYILSIANNWTDGPYGCQGSDFSGDFVLDPGTPSANALCRWEYGENIVCPSEPACQSKQCRQNHGFSVAILPKYDFATKKGYFDGFLAAGSPFVGAECLDGSVCDFLTATYRSAQFDIRDLAGFGSIDLAKISESYKLGVMLGGTYPNTITLSEP